MCVESFSFNPDLFSKKGSLAIDSIQAPFGR